MFKYLFTYLALTIPNLVLAAISGAGDGQNIQFDNPLGNMNLITFLDKLLDVVIIFATPIIVFFIILAGFNYVMARGNSSKIETANKALLYAVIGGVIIVGAKAILIVISGTISDLNL